MMKALSIAAAVHPQPAILLTYAEGEDLGSKIRKRFMPIRNVRKSNFRPQDLQSLADQLIQRHEPLATVERDILIKFLHVIHCVSRGIPSSKAIADADSLFDKNRNSLRNKTTDTKEKEEKEKMKSKSKKVSFREGPHDVHHIDPEDEEDDEGVNARGLEKKEGNESRIKVLQQQLDGEDDDEDEEDKDYEIDEIEIERTFAQDRDVSKVEASGQVITVVRQDDEMLKRRNDLSFSSSLPPILFGKTTATLPLLIAEPVAEPETDVKQVPAEKKLTQVEDSFDGFDDDFELEFEDEDVTVQELVQTKDDKLDKEVVKEEEDEEVVEVEEIDDEIETVLCWTHDDLNGGGKDDDDDDDDELFVF